MIIILGTIRGQGGPSVQLYIEEYIHNKMLEETESVKDEMTLQKIVPAQIKNCNGSKQYSSEAGKRSGES